MLVGLLVPLIFPDKEGRKSMSSMLKSRLLISDFILSFMWVWTGSLLKIFLCRIPWLDSHQFEDIVKSILFIASDILFAWLGKKNNGGTHNPLSILARPFSGDINALLFIFLVRFPTQMFGSIIGVSTIKNTFPQLNLAPRLNVHVRQGALIEGILTFIIVSVYFWLHINDINNFFIKTWIKTIIKFSLHILGSDLTGGSMNPSTAMGWTIARGNGITRESIIVYSVAPVVSTFLAVFIFDTLLKFHDIKKEKKILQAKRTLRLLSNVNGNVLIREFHRGKLIRRFPTSRDIIEFNQT